MKNILPLFLFTFLILPLKGYTEVETLDADTSYETFLDEMMEMNLKSFNLVPQAFKVDEERIKNEAPVVIVVNRAEKGQAKDAQTLKVYHYGSLIKTIPVSTGLPGHLTPTGYYRPTYTNHIRVYQDYFSGTYGASPMKHAVFFVGGVALHSTTVSAYKNLGKRASHGCVRMTEEDAKWVNELVRSTGSQNTTLKKWRHEKFVGTSNASKWNSYYAGLEVSVSPINKNTGLFNRSGSVKSVDTIIVVKDEAN